MLTSPGHPSAKAGRLSGGLVAGVRRRIGTLRVEDVDLLNLPPEQAQRRLHRGMRAHPRLDLPPAGILLLRLALCRAGGRVRRSGRLLNPQPDRHPEVSGEKLLHLGAPAAGDDAAMKSVLPGEGEGQLRCRKGEQAPEPQRGTHPRRGRTHRADRHRPAGVIERGRRLRRRSRADRRRLLYWGGGWGRGEVGLGGRATGRAGWAAQAGKLGCAERRPGAPIFFGSALPTAALRRSTFSSRSGIEAPGASWMALSSDISKEIRGWGDLAISATDPRTT